MKRITRSECSIVLLYKKMYDGTWKYCGKMNLKTVDVWPTHEDDSFMYFTSGNSEYRFQKC